MERANVSDELVRDLDVMLGEACRRVQDEEVTQAKVTLAFTVALDQVGELVGVFSLVGASTRRGEWQPNRPRQLAMDLAPREESGLQSGERAVSRKRAVA